MRHISLLLVVVLHSFPTIFLKAQDLDYAKEIVQKLCLPEFHGRGYVKKGDQLAAEFIISEFRKSGLMEITKDYRQEFQFDVNVQPGKLELQLNDQTTENSNIRVLLFIKLVV